MSIQSKYKQEREQIQVLLNEMGEMLAKHTGFVQRQSKIGGNELIQILSLGCLENGSASLSTFCQVASDLGIEISEAGIHYRLNPEAVELLRQVCHLYMHQGNEEIERSGVLMAFNAVRIFDSSHILLSKEHAEIFPTSRNSAAMKVQLAYEYHSGQMEALEVETGLDPDQKCDLSQELSQKGDLAIFDLGYFKQERFAELNAAGVYFLSRFYKQTGLYDVDNPSTKVDLLTYLKGLPPEFAWGERRLLMGGREKVPVRVVYYRVPEEVAQERRRKAKQRAKKSGKTCQQSTLDWLDWFVFVTNVPEEVMNIEQVATVYRVRWQVEILFKVWKQELDWGKMGKWRIERILCQFYARCLALLLFHRLLKKYQSEWDWEISWQKAIKVFNRKIHTLIEIVSRHFRGILSFLKGLDRDFRRFAPKSKRRTSLSTYDLLELVRA